MKWRMIMPEGGQMVTQFTVANYVSAGNMFLDASIENLEEKDQAVFDLDGALALQACDLIMTEGFIYWMAYPVNLDRDDHSASVGRSEGQQLLQP